MLLIFLRALHSNFYFFSIAFERHYLWRKRRRSKHFLCGIPAVSEPRCSGDHLKWFYGKVLPGNESDAEVIKNGIDKYSEAYEPEYENVGFFKKNGYLLRGELKDVPKGHDCCEFYKKDLKQNCANSGLHRQETLRLYPPYLDFGTFVRSNT